MLRIGHLHNTISFLQVCQHPISSRGDELSPKYCSFFICCVNYAFLSAILFSLFFNGLTMLRYKSSIVACIVLIC